MDLGRIGLDNPGLIFNVKSHFDRGGNDALSRLKASLMMGPILIGRISCPRCRLMGGFKFSSD